MTTAPSAIFLSEYLLDLHEGAAFLDGLRAEDRESVTALGTQSNVDKGDRVFNQGEPHVGIWIIESGRVRTYYAGPTGREITLACWTSGHFVGGPEVFGGGRHVWSADVLDDNTSLLFVSGASLRNLVYEVPDVAIALIEGLVAKGKAYSALIQMLGTRSVSGRLQQLLLILAYNHSREETDGLVIARTMTNEQIATIVGATRQWVTQSLENLQRKGVLSVSRKEIVVHHPESLRE